MNGNDLHLATSPPLQTPALGQGRALRIEQLAQLERVNTSLPGILTGQQENLELIPIHTNNMRASGLQHGGLALIDRQAKPQLGAIVAVRFNGIVIMRRLEKRDGRFCLASDDPREEILFVEGAEIERLGNVIWSLFKT